MKPLLLVLMLSTFHSVLGQTFDAKKYTYTVMLNDKNNEVSIKSHLILERTNKEKDTLKLNLIQKTPLSKKGMTVTELELNGSQITNYKHIQDTLFIPINNNVNKISLHLNYHGIPKDGLIISTLSNQDKTYFSDHWPNRARNWLASIDSPSDKAKVEFKIYTPKGYETISNGLLKEKKSFENFDYFDWETNYEIPTKVMAIGVAKFQSEVYETNPLNISGYTFDGNPNHYQKSVKIVKWFKNKLKSSYPFQKLSNVQSKTRYGGMENAGCIFYNEKSVQSDAEQLMAHEIAHQWFGNSVTETRFEDLWLSEGFATFLENQYIKDTKGQYAYDKIMLESKQSIIQFHARYPNKVIVPHTINDPNTMLNTYSYQKGAWFLHTLEKEVGETVFWKTLHIYYNQFKFKNATTNDFKNLIEKESKRDLTPFFNQWLYKSELPKFEL